MFGVRLECGKEHREISNGRGVRGKVQGVGLIFNNNQSQLSSMI